jgi:ATP-dependent 26S proteasome regulatory subunit
MTTNCITKLDNALVRLGYIDHQVHFALATHEQIRKIFERIYDSADSSTKYTSETSHAEIYKRLVKCDNVAFDLGAYMPLAIVQHRKINELAELFT